MRRTDLAVEAHVLWQAAAKGADVSGVTLTERERDGFAVTAVDVQEEAAAKAMGKPVGRYVTLTVGDLSADTRKAERAAQALGKELRRLLPRKCTCALIVGLGNRAMTPDAIGPASMEHLLVTRHLRTLPEFSSLAEVSAIVPNVLGKTGLEAAELVRGAAERVQPDVIVAVDALASQRLGRVCTTVQLSDSGIIPGSGVGNHRSALTRKTMGVPVLAVGVPTVVDAATLVCDALEEAGVPSPSPAALRGHEGVTVTPRDIDAQVELLARVVGFGISLALHPQLDCAALRALLG